MNNIIYYNELQVYCIFPIMILIYSLKLIFLITLFYSPTSVCVCVCVCVCDKDLKIDG